MISTLRARLLLLDQVDILRMKRDASIWPATKPGRPAVPWEMNCASSTLSPAERSTSRPRSQLRPPTPPAAESRRPLRSAAVLMSPGTT